LVEVSIVNSKGFEHDDELIGLLVDGPSLEVLSLENCLPGMLNRSLGGETIYLHGFHAYVLAGQVPAVENAYAIFFYNRDASSELYIGEYCNSQ